MSHRHMDEVAAVYDRAIPAHVRDHYLRKRVGFIRERFQYGVILDVGCGTGLLDVALREAGFDVIGIDESMGMLKECQHAHHLPCLCGSSSCLPLASNSVDAAICVATLHHIRQEELVRLTVSEMLRVVKPGGWILLWDHNPLNPYWPFLMRRLPQDQEPTRLVPLRELLEDLKGNMVLRIDAKRSGFVPDFAPRRLLWFFQALEWVVERLPGLRLFCAHNVVLVQKLSVDHVAA